MNSAAFESPTLNLRSWLILLALIFLSQLVLIYLLSARAHAVATTPTVTASPLQLFPERLTESEFAETFLASDPALFAAANPRGFSGAAWLKAPTRNYEQSNLAERSQTPFWLALNLQHLGNDISRFVRTNTITPVAISENAAPKIQFALVLEPANSAKTNSQLRVEGDLSSRPMIDPPRLPSWAHTELVSNSVAQVAVDRRGTVLSARLLVRSGFAKADEKALTLARTSQFVPGGKSDTTWGKLIFDWHTIPVAETNEVKAVQP